MKNCVKKISDSKWYWYMHYSLYIISIKFGISFMWLATVKIRNNIEKREKQIAMNGQFDSLNIHLTITWLQNVVSFRFFSVSLPLSVCLPVALKIAHKFVFILCIFGFWNGKYDYFGFESLSGMYWAVKSFKRFGGEKLNKV